MQSKFSKILVLIALFSCSSKFNALLASEASTLISDNLATISKSEQFLLDSVNTGKSYVIKVAGPTYFVQPDEEIDLPVIYVLDESILFGPVSSAARIMALEGLVQYAYVVGIGYVTDNQIELNRLRSQDLVHEHIDNVALGAPGGGGADFQKFIVNELKPFIEEKYPVRPSDSVLIGHSLGGLFGARLFLDSPQVFGGFVIGSPSIQFDPDLPVRLNSVPESEHKTHLMIGVGEQEASLMVESAARLAESTKSDHLSFRVFENETHTSLLGSLISAGLRHVLAPRDI